MIDRLIGLGAMATRAGVPRGWLRAEAEAGRIPHLRAGARLLFRVDLVERVLLARAGGEAPDPRPWREEAREEEPQHDAREARP